MKKIIALLMSLILILGTVSVYADVKVFETADINTEAGETLYYLGLIKSATDEDREKGVITRGEIAAIMLKMMGQNLLATDYEGIFNDVPESHQYRKEIEFAYNMGLVSGKNVGFFAPDAPVTYEELAAMLVNTLGFGQLAMVDGGYPIGYLITAQKLGILNGVTVNNGEIIRCGDAWRMIFNTLEADWFVAESVNNDMVIGSVSEKTLLSAGMKIGHYRGIVEANDISYLDGVGGLMSGMVKIDGEQYIEGTSGASELLGYYVDYYVDLSGNDDSKTVIYARANSRNNILTIDSKDLSTDDSAYGKYMIVYDNNGRETFEISKYADFIYNGVWKNCDDSDLEPDNGSITLIDNNHDGQADVVFIVNYKTIVVKSVAKDSSSVFDKYDVSKNISLDDDNGNNRVKILRDGKVETIRSIKEWSILSVAESKNTTGGKNVLVLHSRDSVNGVLEEKNDETVTINGEQYEVTPEMKPRIASISVGINGTWYFDASGKLAAYDESDGYVASMDYAYLIAVDLGLGLEPTIRMKLLMTSGGVKIFQVAKRVSINGRSTNISDGVALQNLLLSTGYSGTVQQLIRCGMNEDGMINRIDTITENAGGEGDILSCDYSVDPAGTKPRYSTYAWGFGVQKQDVMINDATKVFRVPTGIETEDKYFAACSPLTTFVHLTEYVFDAYDLSSTNVCGALVYRDNPRPKLVNAPTGNLVESVSKSVSEDGEIKTTLHVWSNGIKSTHMLEDEELLQDESMVPGKCINPGDMVIFATNTSGEISSIQKFLNVKTEDFGYVDYENPDFNTNEWWFYTNLRLTVGHLLAVDGVSFLMSYGEDANDVSKQEPKRIHPTAMFSYVYYVKRGKVIPISTAELENYTNDKRPNVKFVVSATGGRPTDCFVIDFDE